MVQKILDVARQLERFPHAGRVVPELGDEAIREHFVYSYRVIYQARDNNTVFVTAVVHGKRMLEPAAGRITGDE